MSLSTMNLQLYLLSRIAAIAALCLLVSAGYALHQSHRQTDRSTRQMAESLVKQLDSQLRLAKAGIGQANPFPDFDVWKMTSSQPGVCITYMASDRSGSRSLCHGAKPIAADWPEVFESVYRRVLHPGRAIVRTIALDGQVNGSVAVTPSAELEILQAWSQTVSLMRLSVVTVFAICLWVYLSMHRALKPARIIVSGLAELEAGHPEFRLPEFDDLGLTASLETLIVGWNRSSGGKTRYRLRVVGDCGRLPDSQAMTLFRIVQEGLNNIHKHAAATVVEIDLVISNDKALLAIRDDGIAEQIPQTSTHGIGLLGMRERLSALHGQLTLRLAEPHGLVLTAEFPVDALAGAGS
ncbi:MAG: sensor histidine kinase [Gammaproteobacteria bacterium]